LVIREFKRHPQFCDLLTQLIEAEHGERSAVEGDVVDRRVARGRPRLNGNRALLYLAYVLSGYSGMWTFYDRLKSTGHLRGMRFREGADIQRHAALVR